MRRARRVLLALALAAGAQVGAAASPIVPRSSAQAYLPPRGHVFAGLSGGASLQPYQTLVGKHPAVFEVFMTWNTPTRWLAAPDRGFRARLALHISTSSGYGRSGVISPEAIAMGHSDRFLLALGHDLARSGRIVYVRLMAEMNGYWNAYAAFSANGHPRGTQNSPRAYRQAWRRTVLIVRGGRLGEIDRRLRALGLPPVRDAMPARTVLPRPRVAFLWVPQDAGSPDIAANAPDVYWPGSTYVDWVGTDFYGDYPNFRLLDRLYAHFSAKPFVISEWALYGVDDPGFVRALFSWVRSHRRLRMLDYYQGFTPHALPSLTRYPHARSVLRAKLSSPLFLAYPPEYAHPAPGSSRPPERPPLPPVPGGVPNPPAPPAGGICLTPLEVCLPALH